MQSQRSSRWRSALALFAGAERSDGSFPAVLRAADAAPWPLALAVVGRAALGTPLADPRATAAAVRALKNAAAWEVCVLAGKETIINFREN